MIENDRCHSCILKSLESHSSLNFGWTKDFHINYALENYAELIKALKSEKNEF